MKFIPLIVVFILFPIANALVFHNVSISNDIAIINTTIKLKTEKKYDVFEISWEIPQYHDIIRIYDEKGDLAYKRQGDYIVFQTNRLRSDTRVINIEYEIKNAVSTEFYPLKKVQLYLSGFSNEETIVNLHAAKIISGDASFGFSEYFDDYFAQFVGNGSADIILYYSNSGREYENYLLFGNTEISAADNIFSIIPNITGLSKPYKRFPVVVLDDNVFSTKIQNWGSATHSRGGLILIKRSVAEGPYNASIILHETMHGFNSKVLKWNQVNPTWFEEGTSSYVEHLANQQLGLKQSELFGNNKVYKDGESRIVIKSKGNKEKLWDYYKNSETFMENWNPENPETRDFGYAFSELVIRYSVMKNGIEKLRDAYSKLKEVESPVTDIKQSNNILLSALDTNFMPCYSVSYENFSECLKEINGQKAEIPEMKINQEEKTVYTVNITHEVVETDQDSYSLIRNILNFLENLFQPIKQFFR
ncbi:MAG: hypothetical protein N3D75_01930 [Candidatus Aenigmarchaeota archaeon]|nr:hypothetical protein [Candidatus Aenigmarchaeota archaeon]